MKQSAAKTLGVAALGAAFAAVGAGAANAAPALPDAGQALGAVAKELPTGNVAQLPGAGRALDQTQPVLGSGLSAAQPAAGGLQNGPVEPVGKLLGGMPVQSMPTNGVQVNGFPIG
ncbi:ATP-binding protein [Streptomyces similanensis]|uniref:ATP-binding protein n=1 Tax=Streptomyces similanensis TaxID=1274988 RepID=A0ABP9KH07_9ACTN